MNEQEFDRLINWLDCGAPEHLFSMHFSWHRYSAYSRQFDDVALERKAKPRCGSICCIAGYLDQGETDNSDWHSMQSNALRKLGLPPTRISMIPLFDPDCALNSPTPQQAADAVRRFRDHYRVHKDLEFNPWSN